MTLIATAPKTIILATDLGPRSDRALERSFALAHKWNAKLTLVHAIEFENYHRDVPSWRQGPDKASILKQRLIEGFKLEGRTAPSIVIETGRPEALVLSLAKEESADLIVTGIAHSEPLGRGVLGNTVATLVRKAACPVLTVKKRLPRGYRSVAVGLDFSDVSRRALLYALEQFSEAEKISVVHAVSVPFRDRVDNPDEYGRKLCDEARGRAEAYLSDVLTPAQKSRVRLVIDEGGPGWLLADYVDDMDVDLVVIGTHGEGGFLDRLMGTAATAILEAVRCDVLVVR